MWRGVGYGNRFALRPCAMRTALGAGCALKIKPYPIGDLRYRVSQIVKPYVLSLLSLIS